MSNVNDHRKGQSVVIRSGVRGKYIPQDFPGWGRPGDIESLVPMSTVAGMRGRVWSVNYHGSNPWTRYTVILDNGGMVTDGVPGNEFEWVTP